MKTVRFVLRIGVCLSLLAGFTSLEASSFTRVAWDGAKITSTRTGDVFQAVIEDRNGAIVFVTQLVPTDPGFGDYNYYGLRVNITFSIEYDLATVTPEGFGYGAEFIYRQVQLAREQEESGEGGDPEDKQGCDGGVLDSCGPYGACCDQHDACYAANGCNSWSWLNPSHSGPCGLCNIMAVECVLGTGGQGEPSQCCLNNPPTCGDPH